MNETGNLVREYVAERTALGRLTGRSPQTVLSVLANFAEHVEVSVADITKRDVTRWLASLGGKTNTQRQRLSQVRSFLEWCVDGELIAKNPARTIELARPENAQPRFLEAEQVGELYKALPSPKRTHRVVVLRNELIVAFAVQMGLRRIEMHRMNVEDIDKAQRTVAIRGKGHRGEVSRWTTITDEAWAALCAYLDAAPAIAGPLFRSSINPKRLDIGEMTVAISDAMRRAGIKRHSGDGKSLHALRHTFAQHLTDAGVDIRDVQYGMGHASSATTEIYTRRSRADGLRTTIEGRSYRDVG